jgi:phospholipase C
MINQIQHIVVLMLENRSFDHMLGFYKHTDPSFKGLSGTESNPWSAGSDVTVSDKATGQLPFDPHHRHQEVTEQLTRGPIPLNSRQIDMKGFVMNAEHIDLNTAPRVMECFAPQNLPVLTALVTEYAVADQWFSSVPGQTWPNRIFAHAGTSDGRVNNRPYKLYGNATIFERLEKASATWRIYHDGFPQSIVLWRLAEGNRPAHFQGMHDFREAVKANALPNYAFIEPQHFFGGSNSQHPGNNEKSNRDMKAGEHLIWSIWKTLISNPTVWAKTLLVITWDEHGGLFDHEKPWATVPPKKGMSTLGFKFDLTGVRVPTVFVSPWIRRGAVDHTVYDHTSIPKSVRLRFAPETKKLTNRDENASSWWDASIWENVMRNDIPNIPEPQISAAPEAMAEALAEPPNEDEADHGWLVREIERILDAKAAGIPVKVAVETKQPAEMAEPPTFATRAELAAYAQMVAEKIR